MSTPPFTALRAFEAVVRLGRVQAAAEELNVTHGAISQQIGVLEGWFGIDLFRRSGRVLEPNDIARAFAAELAPALRKITLACRTAEQAARESVVTVACIPSFANLILVPALSELKTLARPPTVHLSYADDTLDRLVGSADVVVFGLDGDYDGSHQATRLLDGRVRAVCSPAYLAKRAPIQAPADLLRCELLHDANKSGWTEWFAAAGVSNVGFLGGAVLQDFALVGTAVLAGSGIALCPIDLIGPQLSSGQLVELFNIEVYDDRAYWLVTAAAASTAAVVFSDWLADVVTRRRLMIASQASGLHDQIKVSL